MIQASRLRLTKIIERSGWLQDAAGDRFDEIELSALVQVTHVGDGAAEVAAQAAERTRQPADVVAGSPFLLVGTKAEVVDKLHGLRDELGINHFVVRDAEGFAPVVDELAGT